MIKRAKNILLNEDAYLKTSFSTPWVISSQLNERETIFIPLRYFVRQTRQTRFPWTKHYYLPLHFHRNSKIHKFWNAFEKFIPSNSSPVVQMKNSPNQGEITVDGKMDNFWFSDDAGLERKHEGITSRLKESWAREMLVGGWYHRVESRNVRRNFWRIRKDEFADSTKSARPNERGPPPRNHVELLFRCRVECKSVRVFTRNIEPRKYHGAAPVFSPPPSFPLADHRLKIHLPY